jgi:hypothetical protein
MGCLLVAVAIALNPDMPALAGRRGKFMYRRILFAAALMFIVAPNLRAQERPDFSGTWKLNLAKSDYGDLQGPESRTDIIEQHDGRISESVTAEGRHRRQQYTLSFATDGSETALPPDTRMGVVTILTVSARWRETALAVTQNLKFQGAVLVATNMYLLSDDGNTLTMILSLNGGSRTDATFVFDRVLDIGTTEFSR